MDNNIASVQQLTKHYDTKASAEPSEGSEENSLAQLEQKLTAPGLSNKELGAIGEQYAAAWLGKLGWQVLARNWKTRFGELDIIMITGEHIVGVRRGEDTASAALRHPTGDHHFS